MSEQHEMRISAEMQDLAAQSSKLPPLIESESYTIYPLPEGFMDHFVLWLWQEGQDFPAERLPSGFEMKVTVENRPGHLMEKSRVPAYIQELNS